MSILLNSKFIFFLLTFVSLGVYSQSIDFTEEEPEEQFKSFSLELSLYNKNNKSNWKDLFKEKNFEEINLFLNSLPISSKDQIFQDLIYQILTSNKVFTKKKISENQLGLIFDKIIEKLFVTGRFNEIEFLYSQYPELSKSGFVLQKMIEGNLLRNRHSEACKILEKNFDENLVALGKIMIMCNILRNQFEKAKLGLQLLKEQNNPGDLFFIDLAFSLMSEKNDLDSQGLKKNLENIKELNPIIISSLQFMDISPNFEQIENSENFEKFENVESF